MCHFTKCRGATSYLGYVHIGREYFDCDKVNLSCDFEVRFQRAFFEVTQLKKNSEKKDCSSAHFNMTQYPQTSMAIDICAIPNIVYQ
jgi:hypothetical protein